MLGGSTKLPAGWASVTQSDGRTYYYREATGETSWFLPTAAPSTASEGASDAAAAAAPGAAAAASATGAAAVTADAAATAATPMGESERHRLRVVGLEMRARLGELSTKRDAVKTTRRCVGAPRFMRRRRTARPRAKFAPSSSRARCVSSGRLPPSSPPPRHLSWTEDRR